jgi:two-component system sensor histidine kinase KdpD
MAPSPFGIIFPRGQRIGWAGYGWGAATALASTALAVVMFSRFELSNPIMVYLLGVVVVAARWGRGPSVAAAILSVAAFDFLFVPPTTPSPWPTPSTW